MLLDIRIITILTLIVNLTGCADVKSFIGNKRARNEAEPLPKQLEQIALSLDKSEYREHCDNIYGPIRRDITWSLDHRMDEILAVMATPTTDDKIEILDAGPIAINKLREKKTGEDKWQNVVDSWKEVETIWAEIRNTSTDRRWVGLNSYVRSLLSDDRQRILNGVNYYFTRTDIPALPEVKSGLDTCEADPNCTNPEFSENADALTKKNYYYNQFLEVLAENKDNRTYIGRFKRWVDFDVADNSFWKNAGITIRDSNTIIVPMNAGPLTGHEALLDSIIVPVWSSRGINVEIEWTDRADVFKIVQTDDIGGRAFVRYSDLTMNISDGVRDTTIAHEFGHVLGLPDEYYTTWNRDTCEYNHEFNDGNIMSSSSSGLKTEDHAESLKSNYGL